MLYTSRLFVCVMNAAAVGTFSNNNIPFPPPPLPPPAHPSPTKFSHNTIIDYYSAAVELASPASDENDFGASPASAYTFGGSRFLGTGTTASSAVRSSVNFGGNIITSGSGGGGGGGGGVTGEADYELQLLEMQRTRLINSRARESRKDDDGTTAPAAATISTRAPRASSRGTTSTSSLPSRVPPATANTSEKRLNEIGVTDATVGGGGGLPDM